jgi:hypothetical protein
MVKLIEPFEAPRDCRPEEHQENVREEMRLQLEAAKKQVAQILESHDDSGVRQRLI